MKHQYRNEKKPIPLFVRNTNTDYTPVSYGSSKVIGIIYESTRGEDIPEIKQLLNRLHDDNKEVFSLKYLTKSNLKENLSEISANTLKKYSLTKKDINILGHPKKKSVKGFIDTKFDILIHFSLSNINSMHYLCSVCQAKVKVAPYNLKYLKIYNMMIDNKEEKELDALVESVIKYLKMLNNNTNQ